MGELGFTKISGAIIATALAVMGLREVSGILFSHGGGDHGAHGEHDDGHEKSLNEVIAERYAYYVPIAEAGGTDVVEEVFDLGLLLASADPSRGERAFRAKCATCHTIDDGGANGQGPNVHAIVGAPAAQKAGFGYSNVLTGLGVSWTYDELNAWLENPSSYARGTSMAFAGLRREGERMDVIAYLAENTPNAPAYPAPLPAEGAVEDAAVDGLVENAEAQIEDAAGEIEAVVTEGVEDLGEAAEDLGDAAEGVVDAAVETAEDVVDGE